MKENNKSENLTFDVEPGGGLQPLSLAHGPVPHCAPVAGAVLLLTGDR